MSQQRSYRFSRAGTSADTTASVSAAPVSITCHGLRSTASGTADTAGRKTRWPTCSVALAMLWEDRKMADEDKPGQTPREKIAKLAAMSDEEFSAFMRWNFNRICQLPLPEDSTILPSNGKTPQTRKE